MDHLKSKMLLTNIQHTLYLHFIACPYYQQN